MITDSVAGPILHHHIISLPRLCIHMIHMIQGLQHQPLLVGLVIVTTLESIRDGCITNCGYIGSVL
jgi:hypothetical protein